jgi:hypothetical protein
VGGEASAIVLTHHELGEGEQVDAVSTTVKKPGRFDPWSLFAT